MYHLFAIQSPTDRRAFNVMAASYFYYATVMITGRVSSLGDSKSCSFDTCRLD